MGDCIIPSRASIQFVEHVDILYETHPGLVRRKFQTIEVNIFMLVIRSKTDNVTLIRSDIDKCELAIKAGQSGVFLSSFRADFDREAEVSLRSIALTRISWPKTYPRFRRIDVGLNTSLFYMPAGIRGATERRNKEKKGLYGSL